MHLIRECIERYSYGIHYPMHGTCSQWLEYCLFVAFSCFFRTLLRHDRFLFFLWLMFYKQKHWLFRSHFASNSFALIRTWKTGSSDCSQVLLALVIGIFCWWQINNKNKFHISSLEFDSISSYLDRNFSFFRAIDTFGSTCLLSQIFSLFSLLM